MLLNTNCVENNKVYIWGTGKPLQEFLWSENVADARIHILLNAYFSDIIGFENNSNVHYCMKAAGVVSTNLAEYLERGIVK